MHSKEQHEDTHTRKSKKAVLKIEWPCTIPKWFMLIEKLLLKAFSSE